MKTVYENTPILQNTYTEQEIERSISKIRCSKTFAYDLNKNKELQKEFDELIDKEINVGLSTKESERLQDLIELTSALVYSEQHTHEGGCHALWIFNRYMQRFENRKIMDEKLEELSLSDNEFTNLWSFYEVYQKSSITNENLIEIAKRELSLSISEITNLKNAIDEISSNIFYIFTSKGNNDDLIRTIAVLIALNKLEEFSQDNDSETIQSTKIERMKRYYLLEQDFGNVRGLIGELILLGILVEANILREIEKEASNGKSPDLQLQLRGNTIEIEIYSPGFPSKLFNLSQLHGERITEPQFLGENIITNKIVGSKVSKEQLSQDYPGYIFVYSAFGFDNLDEYKEFVNNRISEDNSGNIVFDDYNYGKNYFDNVNGIIISDLNDLRNIKQNSTYRAFQSSEYNKDIAQDLLDEFIRVIDENAHIIADEILEKLEKISQAYSDKILS